jgi:hypothetical protein
MYVLDQQFQQQQIVTRVQVELAKVQDNVSNVTVGRMRMQFWRDAVKNIGLVRRSFSLLTSKSLNIVEVGSTTKTPYCSSAI